MTELAPNPVFREAELDKEIEQLIGRIVSDMASAADRLKFEELARERIRMMQVRPVERHHRLLRRAAAG